MIYSGKTGKFFVDYDRIVAPSSVVKSEQADDFVTDLANAISMMHRLQDKLLENGAMP